MAKKHGGGPKLKPDAVKAMRSVVRDRQNCYADWLDELGWADLGLQEGDQPIYDWRYDIAKRWMPSNGVYYPEVQYVQRVNSGYYIQYGVPGTA